MRKSWASLEQVMGYSWASHDIVICKSWASHEQVMNKSCATHEQVMSKSWASHEKIERNSWESHEKAMRKSWENHEKVCSCLFSEMVAATKGLLSIFFIVVFLLLPFGEGGGRWVDQWEALNWSYDHRANERPQTDHVIRGPTRGLEKIAREGDNT